MRLLYCLRQMLCGLIGHIWGPAGMGEAHSGLAPFTETCYRCQLSRVSIYRDGDHKCFSCDAPCPGPFGGGLMSRLCDDCHCALMEEADDDE